MTSEQARPQYPLPVIDFIILSHAILAGAAIIVPVPFVDDFLSALIRKNLVKALAKHYGVVLSAEEVALLANLEASGCLQSCLTAFAYPLREISREIFKVFEIKQSVETATHTYYLGVLLNEIFLNGWYARENINLIKSALLHAKKGANKELVREVFRAALATSQQNYGALAAWIRFSFEYQLANNKVVNWIKRARIIRKAATEHPEKLFESPPPNILELLGQLATNLNENLLGKPQEHLQELKNRLAVALKPGQEQT